MKKTWGELTNIERINYSGSYYNSDVGTTTYYKNGKIHAMDGPAVIHSDCSVEYWLDGVQYEKEEFDKKVSKTLKASSKSDFTLEITQIVINGKKYNLIPAD